MVKDVKIYFIGSKKTCLGVLDREDRDKDNEICLKEGRAIEMSTTVLPFAMLALFACSYQMSKIDKGEKVVP